MSNDPLEAVFVTGDEAAALKRADTARKLATYLERMPVELRGMFAEEFQRISRAELASLRADLQAERERNAQQARQLEAAREIFENIFKRDWTNTKINDKARAWLTANAPQEQSA